MPFSIVLTREGKAQLISLVPSTWVIIENGSTILNWPKTKKKSDLEVLRRNEFSMPENGWKKLKCTVKVCSVDSFTEGLKLEEQYSKFEDTEDEERYYKERENRRKHPVLSTITKGLQDFNSEFEIENNETNKESDKINISNLKEHEGFEENNWAPKKMDESEEVVVTNKAPTAENTKMAVDSELNSNLVTLPMSQLNELISEHSSLSTENKILKESITRFGNLEQQTKRGFACIQVQLDKLFDLHKQTISESQITGNTPTSVNEGIADRNIKFPINCKEQLDLLEELLVDKEYRNALVNKFSETCGTSGTQNISKIGTLLMQCMFTDELLCQFTWKGIKGCSKVPFIKYIKARQLVYKILKLACQPCSANDTDSFLQNSAIKHSGQRLKRKSSYNQQSENHQKKRKEQITLKDSEYSFSLIDLGSNQGKENYKIENTIQQREVIKYNNDNKILQPNNAENYIDEDIPGTSYEIKPTKKVHVLSDKNDQTKSKEELALKGSEDYISLIDMECTMSDVIQGKENYKIENMVPQSVTEVTNKLIKYNNDSKILQPNHAGNEIDDNIQCTSYAIKPSNKVTVLSDVKITNKITDLKDHIKATNISSDDLINSLIFNERY